MKHVLYYTTHPHMKPQYCVTQDAEHKDFDIQAAVATSYPETGLPPLYFVAENMDDMRNKMMWVDSWVALIYWQIYK